MFGTTLAASEIRIELGRKTNMFLSERSPKTFATLKNESLLLSGGGKYVVKIAKKGQLTAAPLNSGKTILLPKRFGNFNFQLKNPNRSSCINFHKFSVGRCITLYENAGSNIFDNFALIFLLDVPAYRIINLRPSNKCIYLVDWQ